LSEIPTIPILSTVDSLEFKTDVALLSRNVKIYGAKGEESKGAYMQVLHTPNISQLVLGVEFVNMGRLSELDRFAIQLLYSGSLEGSSISKNSFHDNWRCIVIDGTSNVTISNNVGHRNNGHCIFIGSQSQDNIIEKNFISQTKSISYHNKWPGYDDYNSAAFKNEYSPNIYLKNVAFGNSYDGFRFYNYHETKLEDGTWNSQINPRKNSMGQFSRNEAKSNGYNGFQIFYNSQNLERNVFDRLVAAKNRYFGLFFHATSRLSVSNSLLAENSNNVEMRFATAFKEGYYQIGDKLFGTGKYGDMAATFASIYLDREIRTVVLDVDPSNGALRESVLKFMSVLRSMDFVSTYPNMRFGNIKDDIGQMNFEFESVFIFFYLSLNLVAV